jgi:signal transduction histidine kinase
MFSTARLRLTLWYLAVLAAIVILLSLALYDVLIRLQQAEVQAIGRVVRHGVAQLFARDAHALAWQIGSIDLGMLILAALGAYVLAGRTLRPIQEAMDRQRRFAVAASHELRTPLTVLQGTMEVALLRERTPAEYQEIVRTAVVEAERMGLLIGDLLALARAQTDREAR